MLKQIAMALLLCMAGAQVHAQTFDRNFIFSDSQLTGVETEDTQDDAGIPTTTVTISVTNNNPSVTYNCTGTVQLIDNLTFTQVQGVSASNTVPPNSTVVVASVPITGGLSGYSHGSGNGAGDTLSCTPQSSGGSTSGGTAGGGTVGGGATGGGNATAGNAVFTGTVFLNAVDWTHDTVDISVGGVANSSTTATTGTLEVQLWFTSGPYSGGTLTGYKIASFRLPSSCSTGSSQLAPGASCVSLNSGTIAASPPPAGTYTIVLVLAEYNPSVCAANGGFCSDQVFNLLNPSTQTVPQTTGQGGGGGGSGGSSGATGNAQFTGGAVIGGIDWTQNSLNISVAGVTNSSATATTGTLEIELWFSTSPYSGGPISGYKVASFRLPPGCTTGNAQLGPAASCTAITSGTLSLTPPPAGTYYAVLTLDEYDSNVCTTNGGFCLDQGMALADQETVPAVSTTSTVGANSGDGAVGGSKGGGGGLDVVTLGFVAAIVIWNLWIRTGLQNMAAQRLRGK